MRSLRIDVAWRTLYTNLTGAGYTIPSGDWVATEDWREVRASGEARAFLGPGAPTLIPGLEFANVESTPLTVVHALTASGGQAVWTPNGWFPPNTTAPWVDISTATGTYLLMRPVWTVIASANTVLHLVDARALYEFRSC